MNFCSHCGSDQITMQILEGDLRERYLCHRCGTVFYDNPKMVVGCLLTYKGKILLARRGIEPRKGFWNLPCGFLENDETIIEGAIREVKEETGLDVEPGQLLTVYNVLHAHQVYFIFKAEAKSDAFVENEESTEIQFFDPEDIPWDELAFLSNTHAIRCYLDPGKKYKTNWYPPHNPEI